MTSGPATANDDIDDPLTVGERRRIGDLLATVTSRTLLQSLTGLCRMSADGRLIIAELVARLPPEEPQPDPPGRTASS